MTYRVNRALGYQPWGVTNPWVFADFGQPQRQRGSVSQFIYTTQPPRLRSEHLGPRRPYLQSSHLGQTAELSKEEQRAQRMERYSMIGLALSISSFGLFAWNTLKSSRKVRANRRPRSRR